MRATPGRMSTTQKIAVGLLFGGARVFLPTDIAGLQLWLDANDASTLFQDAAKTTPAGNGDVVGAWGDKSGQGNDATQTTTAAKPTVQFNVLNGKSVLRFDGTDDFLSTGAFAGGSLSQPTTFFLVEKISSLGLRIVSFCLK